MARHLPVVRIRLSTALIALVFLVKFSTHLLVRPSTGPHSSRPSPPGLSSAEPTAR